MPDPGESAARRSDPPAVEARPGWPGLPDVPGLAPGDVHVVRTALDLPASEAEALRCHLNPPELERADRFRRRVDARRAVVARAVLRLLLGRYLDRAPGAVELVTSSRGKPMLRPNRSSDPLHFNLSHAGGIALYALTRVGPVGVDVECVRRANDLETLAERFFSPREAEALRTLDPPLRPLAFFRCWTRKEAVMKAIGEGLLGDPSSFDVTLRPGEPAELVGWRGGEERSDRWHLHHLVPARGQVGALAVRGGVRRVRSWTWTVRGTGAGRSTETRSG